MRVVAAHAIRASLRRRVFVVVLVLSLVFLGLYAWGASADSPMDVVGFSVYPSLAGSITEAGRRLMAHDDLD